MRTVHFRHICEPTNWSLKQVSYLYRHVGRWIIKHYWLAIDLTTVLTQEFTALNSKIERPPRITLYFIVH